MRKYLAEVEKSKNPDGYVSSGSAGVSLRRLKRKEPSGKGDAGVIEVDDLEGAGGNTPSFPSNLHHHLKNQEPSEGLRVQEAAPRRGMKLVGRR
jgi:hypothetical protein